MRRAVSCGLVGAVVAVLAACTGDGTDGSAPEGATERAPAETTTTTLALPAGYAGYESGLYADPAHWLCRAAADDYCHSEMDATVVAPDGTTEIEPFEPVDDAPVDCFYVYPTVSADPGPNSDLVPGEHEEIYVVRNQAARLGTECRVFAPLYRQSTLAGLTSRLGGATAPAGERVDAYGDVLDAWKHYMANDNGGRGVVLIGHSQGAGLLTRLVRDEIDPDPNLRARLVSAMIFGWPVPDATFANVATCRDRRTTGCVVGYASFRATAPPPADALFGQGGTLCANPAALGGGKVALHPYFPTRPRAQANRVGAATDPVPWAGPDVEITTPFVALPGLVEAECVAPPGHSFLALSVVEDPGPRLDVIRGDLTPQWGMHLIDVNVAMGDIVTLVREQIASYTAS
jgi:hypothetical protein